MKDASTPAEALRFAVEHLGSQSAMARLLGVSQPSVWEWLNKGKALPAKHVRTVEKAIEADTGINRFDLRPDLFVRGEHDSDLASASATVACDRSGFPHRGGA